MNQITLMFGMYYLMNWKSPEFMENNHNQKNSISKLLNKRSGVFKYIKGKGYRKV